MTDNQKKLLKDIDIDINHHDLSILNWHKISNELTLTEEFIREFKEFINWGAISSKQKLSEEFIFEFTSKV